MDITIDEGFIRAIVRDEITKLYDALVGAAETTTFGHRAATVLVPQEAHSLARDIWTDGGEAPLGMAHPDLQDAYVRRAVAELARREAAVRAERDRCARIAARVGANKGDESGYLGGVAAEIEEAIRGGEG